MQCFHELVPPTAVTNAVTLSFTSPNSNNLIVAKSSLLQIFSLKTVTTEVDPDREGRQPNYDDPQVAGRREFQDENVETSFIGTDLVLQRSERSQTTKLVLVSEYSLFGTITSLARVKILNSKAGGDALLIAFRDAKLSLVEWDPERHGISTTSIHYYESEDILRSPWAPELSQCQSYITVDPSSRCAVLKFGMRTLAILPFHQAGDDLVMDDYDPDLDGELPDAPKQPDGESSSRSTPYASSFVLSLSSIQPRLVYPIHLTFLYEYREPTFGILSSQVAPSASLLSQRRDTLSYGVYTLELEQRQSTELLSIGGLPYDLFKIIPLPLPVGGSLLVGGNELIHVDQSGRTNGVAVNEFAKQCSSFSMADQSSLAMRLENCAIEQLGSGNGDMLIVLNTGELALLDFAMDGRVVSGLSIRRIAEENGGSVLEAGASCTAILGRGKLFIGSENSDSVILGWSRKSRLPAKQDTDANILADAEEDLDLDDLEDHDDIYSAGPQDAKDRSETLKDTDRSQAGDYRFKVNDSIMNLAPMRELALGQPAFLPRSEEERNSRGVVADLELVVPSGRDRAGGISVLKHEVDPKVIGRFEFPEAQGVWSVSAKRPLAKGIIPQSSSKDQAGQNDGYTLDNEFHRFMIVSKAPASEVVESAVYALTPTGFEEIKGTEFDPAAGGTIDVGTLAGETRVVQVLPGELRSYDGELGLAQIFPMTDDLTGAEPKAVGTSFADPYLLVIRDDSSIVVLEADDSGDIDEVERGDSILATKWLSGSLYKDHSKAFLPQAENGSGSSSDVLLFLLSVDGALQIYNLPNLSKPIYVADSLSFLPPILSAEYAVKRSTARETLMEIMVTDLGDQIAKSPYMILRTANDDLVIYEPYKYSSSQTLGDSNSALHFIKIPNQHFARSPAESAQDAAKGLMEQRANPLRTVSNIGGYSAVFLPGSTPSFILKSACSMPRVIKLRGKAVRGMSGFHTAGCERGWVYVDIEGIARVSQFPNGFQFGETGWASHKVTLGEEVQSLCYHAPMESYVIGTTEKVPYKLPDDDDFHHEWKKEDTSFLPEVQHGFIKILNPINYTVVDTYPLDHSEVPLCIKTLHLEVNETTHERQLLVAVGTAIIRGEDLSTRGCIYIFEIITVVPEPGRPETNRKLKLVVKEEVKGAVTALSEIGSQGFLLAAQGQKCMVRGLKEDGSLLPVAFMDMQCYVSVAKELKGTGLCVLGDAVKGVWFVGYSEEPYKMTLFGKDTTHLEVLTADFLPDGNQLFILVADGDCNFHILQFDPEHPRSLSGQRLLHRSAFHIGHLPTSLTLLPSSLPSASSPSEPDDDAMDDVTPEHPAQQLLVTTQSGALGLITPVTETQYRRLSALQTQLTNGLEHACGLNPRAYRAVNTLADPIAARSVLDGSLLSRFWELGSQRRREICSRIGCEMWEIRGDLEIVSGGGLNYL